jgi:hypothetical protein
MKKRAENFFLLETGPGADGVNKYSRSDESGGISHSGIRRRAFWALLCSLKRKNSKKYGRVKIFVTVTGTELDASLKDWRLSYSRTSSVFKLQKEKYRIFLPKSLKNIINCKYYALVLNRPGSGSAKIH